MIPCKVIKPWEECGIWPDKKPSRLYRSDTFSSKAVYLHSGVTVMLVTLVCWWLYDDDWFEMSVADHYVGDFFRYVGDFLNVLIRSPTSQTWRQHIWSTTSVADIDVTDDWWTSIRIFARIWRILQIFKKIMTLHMHFILQNYQTLSVRFVRQFKWNWQRCWITRLNFENLMELKCI